MSEVYDNFKDGDLPMRPSEYVKSKAPCSNCPLKKACWAKDAEFGTVQIEPYKVPKL